MRGIFSLLVLVAGCLPLALMAGTFIYGQREITKTSRQLSMIESVHASGSEFQNLVAQVLGKGKESGTQGVIDASLTLMHLEEEMERKLARDGVLGDLWFGDCGWSGIENALIASHANKRGAKCAGCHDFSTPSADFGKKPVPLSSSFLYFGDGLKISKRGLTTLPDPLLSKYPVSDICFGASLHYSDFDASVVHLLREGFP